MDAPTNQPAPQDPSGGPAQPPQGELPARPGADLLTIGLLVFFIALIVIVAALLLLPLLNG